MPEPRSYKTRLAVGFLAGLLLSKDCLKWGFLLCYCPLKATIQPKSGDAALPEWAALVPSRQGSPSPAR